MILINFIEYKNGKNFSLVIININSTLTPNIKKMLIVNESLAALPSPAAVRGRWCHSFLLVRSADYCAGHHLVSW